MKIAVLSNKPHHATLDVIESLFGKDYFDVVQGQVDGVPIKPDPAGVFRILDKVRSHRRRSTLHGRYRHRHEDRQGGRRLH
ncbi:phosphoglycolate phosphatase, partial [human gut metagenome]